MTGESVAVIDCGTNTVNLLVADERGDVERIVTMTGLGDGVDGRRLLAPDAVARTLDVLRGYRQVIERLGAGRVRAVATSAVRDATNGDEFVAAASSALGFGLEVIDGDEEARLAFEGAARGLDKAGGPFLVADIGGGSTELVLGTEHAEHWQSIDVGSRRITERYLTHDPPLAEELTNAIGSVQDHVDDVLREIPAVTGYRTLIGVAGTVSTVAAVELGLARYDRAALHHFVLTREAAEDVFRTLATEALADRVHNPGLPAERAGVIVGGCCVVVGLMRKLRADQMLVSEANNLDGMASRLLYAP